MVKRELSAATAGKIKPDASLAGIIKDAYSVFDYPKPDNTEVCKSCCMDPAIEADFFTPAIQDMPLSYLHDWYNAAYETSGVSRNI